MATWSKKPKDNLAVARGRLRKLLPSGVWHFHFKDSDDRWVSRTTHHRDKLGAIRWAEAHSLDLTKAEFGLDKPSPSKPAPTVVRGLVQWLRYHRQQSSDETVKSYHSIGLKFWRFLRSIDSRRFDQITRETMMQFRTHCLEKRNSRVTVDNNLIAIRAFFSWSIAKKWIGENPASEACLAEKLFFNERPVRKETYTRAEFDGICAAASGIDRDVFTLLGRWGLRISELAMLEWTDIDLADGWVRIRNKVTQDGVRYCPKDRTDRRIPLEDKRVRETLQRLAQQLGRTGYLIPLSGAKSRRRQAERLFLGHLKRLAAQTGIDAKRLTLHRFRQFFVSECADAGVPMATTMEWVGHDEMKMVMHYYNLRDESAREAMRRLSDNEARPQSSDRKVPTTEPVNHPPQHPRRRKRPRGRRRAS